MGRGEGLATSCVSCCSYVVKAIRVVLMLFSETFCLSVSLWRWCCRYPKALAMPWGCLEATTSREQSFQRAGYDRRGQPIRWLSTRIVQGSVSRILICCKGNWGTRLQENPQLILQFAIMIQLTSRRILRNQDEAPEEMFYTIYWVCILSLCDQSYTSVFKYYFSNT